MTIKRILFTSIITVSLFSACGDDPVAPTPEPGLSSTGIITPISSSSVYVPPVSSAAQASFIGLGANPLLVDQWYPQWKAKYLATLQDDLASGLTSNLMGGWFINNAPSAVRVKWNGSSNGCLSAKQSCTVSEGMGYGMLIALFQEDWETFHNLYLYAYGSVTRDYGSTGSYMMPWIMDSFSEWKDLSAATDADLDIATALVLASFKLNAIAPDLAAVYLAHAKNVINAIWNETIVGLCSQNYLICSGNSSMWYKEPVTFNLSYFAPVAFRLFQMVDPAHDWNAVITANYNYMKTAQNLGVGLVPDWSDASGLPVLSPNGSSTLTYNTYGKEAVRSAWRIAWDYYWFGTPDAKLVLDKMAGFIVPQITTFAVSSMPSKAFVTTDGSVSKASTQAVAHLGSYCLMGVASYAEWYQNCVNGFNAEGWNTSYSYFTHVLQMMFAQLINGKYVKPF